MASKGLRLTNWRVYCCIEVSLSIHLSLFHTNTVYMFQQRAAEAERQSKANKPTTPKDSSFFSRKEEELPWVGFEPTTLCFLGECSTTYVHTYGKCSKLTHCGLSYKNALWYSAVYSAANCLLDSHMHRTVQQEQYWHNIRNSVGYNPVHYVNSHTSNIHTLCDNVSYLEINTQFNC